MPYASNKELPKSIRDAIPTTSGKTLFRNVVNSQLGRGKSDSVSFASAWAALQRAGWEKGDNGKWVKVSKQENKQPMYVSRRVKNADEIMKWAKEQGFKSVVNEDDLHVTVVFSRDPMDFSSVRSDDNEIVVKGGKRVVQPLGDDGAVVLKFESGELQKRWGEYRKAGASWDYESYQPHVTITYEGADIDLDSVEPYSGDIVLKAEVVEPLDLEWKDKVVEKAQYKGKDVELNKPFRTPDESKKFAVYVQDGDNVKIVRFGDPDMEIRRDDDEARASFRARHKCDQQKDKTSAAYWSCRMWDKDMSVGDVLKRQIGDDSFTVDLEAIARSVDLGLGGEIHVYEDRDGNATYMPGKSHEEYLEHMASRAGLEEGEEEGDEEEGRIHIEITIKSDGEVIEKQEDQRIVYGWASVIEKEGEPVVDRQGDVIEEDELIKAVHDFVSDSRTGKVMHDGGQTSRIVDSIVMTKDLQKALGIDLGKVGWFVGVKIDDDETWELSKSGKLPMFSIGGQAVREKIDG